MQLQRQLRPFPRTVEIAKRTTNVDGDICDSGRLHHNLLQLARRDDLAGEGDCHGGVVESEYSHCVNRLLQSESTSVAELDLGGRGGADLAGADEAVRLKVDRLSFRCRREGVAEVDG